MFYISYDLAKQITEDRQARAMAASARRRRHTPREVPRREEHAEVIELAFGTHCQSQRIGA